MKVNHKNDNALKINQKNNFAWRQNLGKIGEDYVTNLLQKQGWQVIERNWRAGRYAEIDIIAYDPQKILVFIEVKTRIRIAVQAGFDNSGYDKLDKKKTNKLLGCARLYMAKCFTHKKQTNVGCRFDAIIVYYPNIAENNSPDILNKIKRLIPETHHVKGFLP